ncbi:maleylpyruvate isomerase family mycothiol-dependent enzyme [Streptosporangium lutulentum]|uniref:Maleylpyruvate isomerase n=1 Tax=Streptosporangium lutulentum TaxID=1461250 RepID=A0ABT9QIB8_9ACTN|nr:maleylpyruvate isomerase family mycothiol-dependent enzyme [Streptosporangium lutulentum]MDP9846508.1 maleylpyruvate isomerase [Streptosporangium lutulentum]
MTAVAPLVAWAREGTELFERTVAGIDDADLNAASALPGWRRGHVAAHVASNADALVNLLSWARTGVPSPMYASPEQRADDIEKGAGLPAEELREKLSAANARFGRALAAMPEDAWDAQVRTARGRTVPASQVPWMRVREVWVHTVDLLAGPGFADFPAPLLRALTDDAVPGFSGRPDLPHVALRATDAEGHWEIGASGGAPVAVSGNLADLTAYLLGRPVPGRLESAAESPPSLPSWL